MADHGSFGEWRPQAEAEFTGRLADPIAVQAHYDLSASYLELRYGTMDHADRARTID
jgi:hypothetical protein